MRIPPRAARATPFHKGVTSAALLLALLPSPALAHSFGKLYTLPVPIWLYLYGAAAALFVSFLIIGWFISQPAASANLKTLELPRLTAVLDRPAVIGALRGVTVFLLLFTILAGYIGKNNEYQNFNMTWFWIIFVLGFAYLTALIGDAYAAISPWKALVEWSEKLLRRPAAGWVRYPERLGYWPALLLYFLFIWIELFGRTRPLSLSVMLTVYTVLNLGGAWLVGRQAWFRYCEFFAVFLRLTALIAPLEYVPPERSGKPGMLRLRQPFIGLVKERAESMSLLLFVLFMLSSTAFDGIRDTLPWVKIYWKDVYQNLLVPIIGTNIVKNYPLLQGLYKVWQTSALALSPLFYFAIYAFLLWLAKLITRSEISLRELCLRFAFSLLPIAFVYNVTHYYTLIVTQGSQIVRLASDPFGMRWNLFGTARSMAAPVLVDAGTVWHTQVALILIGHIFSVYLAHLVALQVFPTHRKATLSQLPMLLLMVAYTTIGLWILSQPLSSGVPTR